MESNHRLVPTTFPLVRFPDVYAVDADPPFEDGAVEDEAEESEPRLCRRGGASGDDAGLPMAAAVGAWAPGFGLSAREGALDDTGLVSSRRPGPTKASWRRWLGRGGEAPSRGVASDGLGIE